MNTYYVYILTNFTKTTLYTGVTNDLERRVREHKAKINEGFSARYNITNFVWFEKYNDIKKAIEAEKKIKKWRRKWKEELISKFNPPWEDLSKGWDLHDAGSSPA